MVLGAAFQRALRSEACGINLIATRRTVTANPPRAAIAVVAGAISVIALTTAYGVISLTPAGARWAGIVPLFHQAATALLEGTARTAFLSWYPPLSLLPITLPRLLAADLGTYAFLLGLEMSIVAGAGVVIVTRLQHSREFRDRAGATLACVAFLLAGTALVAETFDIVPAVLTLATLAATLRRRSIAAGGLLGVAAALKIYPAVLLPALLLRNWSRGERKEAASVLYSFAIAVAVGIALYLLFPPASPIDLFKFHADRALQIESVPASMIGLGSALGMVGRPAVVFSSGSFNIVGPAADAALTILSVVGPIAVLTALVATVFGMRRVRRDDVQGAHALVLSFGGLLLVLLLTSKFLSPQYLIWLLPVVPFLATTQRALALVAMLLTAAVFPFMYDGVIGLQPIPMAVLVLRNALLVGLFVWVLLELSGLVGRTKLPGPLDRPATAFAGGIGG